jgi:hypothetical protein
MIRAQIAKTTPLSISAGSAHSFFFIFSFILNGYASGISGVSLGALVMVLYMFLALFLLSASKIKVSGSALIQLKAYLVMFFLLFLISAMGLVDKSSEFTSWGSVLVASSKVVILLIIASLTTFLYFDYKQLRKWIKRFAILLTLYILLQSIFFYIFSIYLPNIFNFWILTPYADGYADYDALGYGVIVRPASFLSESSFYGNFALCALMVSLFGQVGSIIFRREFYYRLFLTFGIILSTSTSAIVLAASVWIFYLLLSKTKITLIIILLFAFILVATGVSINLNADIGFLSTITNSIDKLSLSSMESSARVGRGFGVLNQFETHELLIGAGIGNHAYFLESLGMDNDVYLNSATKMVLHLGYIGTLIFITFFLFFIFYRSTRLSALIIFIYLLKGFSSGMWFGMYGILYLVLASAHVNYVFYKYKAPDQGASS